RSGRRQELLSGPLLYGAVHVVATVLFWTSTPSGVIAIAVLCFGDGAAELAGRRATAKLWHNRKKTWAGSFACFVAGAVAATAYAFLFQQMGTYDRPVGAGELCAGALLCAAVGAAVESLPLEGDNFTVPVAVVVTSVWFFSF
ncbi:putative phytol kinase 3, chloroplastic, partial [Tetrabaena socialis]